VDLGLLETFGLAIVGDPAECRDRLRKYAASGVTHLLLAFGAGAVEGTVVRESLELFAREVMPALRQDPAFNAPDSASPLAS
jgi:alkanesulfonate monooxygenase SsuD/methylene tetrahydromethanopterin reductase-like flavin-dependent oxidoreductase (luciferase family)